MRRLTPRAAALLVLLLLLLLPSAEARRRAVSAPTPLAIPAADAAAAAALADGVPGITVAVRKGTSTFARAYGVADLETNAPATTHTVFQVASVSKQFTAAAIMRLVEEGKLSIDDRARTWLPELDSRFDAITIRHLLVHHSGVRDYIPQLGSLHEPKTQQEIIALIASRPPLFPAGAGFLYSNSGYYLLGVIIERATSKTYAQALRDEFFLPLALGSTSYCGDGGPVPDGYVRAPGGPPQRFAAMHPSLVYAAGALCSTAFDLVRWNAALVSGLAVSRESYQRMTTEVVALDEVTRYGFGLIVDELDGRRRIWHNGGLPGFASHLAWFPDEELSIAVIVNLSDTQRSHAMEIAEAIARAMNQSP